MNGLFGEGSNSTLFPSSNKQNMFSKANIKDKLVTVTDMLDLNEAQRKIEEEKTRLKELISKAAKRPLFRLYNDSNELLFVTITNQFQSLMAKDWYWIDPPTNVDIEYFHTRDEQDEAKILAIQNEHPKWNSHNIPK